MSHGPLPNSYWLPGNEISAGEYPGHHKPDITRERLATLLDAGIRSFVDLTEATDPLRPYAEDLHALGREREIEVRWVRLPIRDMNVPPRERMEEILAHLDAEVAAGRKVYVHCWGGVGRTGTVVGCHFVRRGRSGEEALAAVAELWELMSETKRMSHAGSPETEAQRRFVRGWKNEKAG